MTWFRNLSLLAAACGLSGVAQAADLSEAQGVVDHIRAAEPPQVSTETKRDPTGDPVSDYKPSGPSPTSEEPPSPVNKNNPQNDPDVQAGYDAHQAEYNSDE